MRTELAKITDIVGKYASKKGALIPLLQEVQSVYGYVPKDAIPVIARAMGVFPVDVYGILTFYAQFYLEPRGKHIIKVCMGTACYIMGGKDILDHVIAKLGIVVDETTKDGVFTLERVACLGCCGMGPVTVVDDKFIGRSTIQKIDAEIDKISAGKTGKVERMAERN
jgi:NADH:ubiquinone oxidoreductase subunit E